MLQRITVAKAQPQKSFKSCFNIKDKAVRPTNIMGASKRLSELCLQEIYNHNKDINTHFSIKIWQCFRIFWFGDSKI